MRRGEIYLVQHPAAHDPKRQRPVVIVSRQEVIDSRHSTVTCAPVFTHYHGFATQVPVGPEHGLKHDSAIHCDELVSFAKTRLTHYVGSLPPDKIHALNRALIIALDLEEEL